MTREDYILVTCALRFDGYRYLDDHPFDHQQAVQRFLETGEWRSSPLEQLTVFFLLQRFLCKWGGEMLPKTSATWNAFRSLFPLVCEYEIPEPYRHGEYHQQWSARYEPAVAEHVALVRAIHQSTEYSADDVVDPAALPSLPADHETKKAER